MLYLNEKFFFVVFVWCLIGCTPSDIEERRIIIVNCNSNLIQKFENVDRNDPYRLRELIGELTSLEKEVKAYTDDANIRGYHKNNDLLISKIEGRIESLNRALLEVQQKATQKQEESNKRQESEKSYSNSSTNSSYTSGNSKSVICSECGKSCGSYFYYSIMCNLMNIPSTRANEYFSHYCSVDCLFAMQKREHLCQFK